MDDEFTIRGHQQRVIETAPFQVPEERGYRLGVFLRLRSGDAKRKPLVLSSGQL